MGTPIPVMKTPARQLFEAVEPIHTAVYSHPQALAGYPELGLTSYWMGFLASRAAALGPVGPRVVTAAFYGFAPAMVAQHVPACWDLATPAAILAVRTRLAAEALAGPAAASGLDIEAVAKELVAAVGRLSFEGRTLAAAHASLPVPDEPLAAVWWGATVLREHRGDGHVAALLTYGISPLEGHVLRVAAGEITQEVLAPRRGWTDSEWSAARLGLFARSLMTEDGLLTDDGAMLRSVLEHTTDTAAGPGWWALGGGDASNDVITRLAALAAQISPAPWATSHPAPEK